MEAAAAKDEQIQMVTANQTAMVAVTTELQKTLAALQLQLKESNDQIASLKKQVAQNNNNNRNTGDTNNSGKGGGGSEWPKCQHCGRKHPPWFKKKCYLHPDLKDKAPEDGGPPPGFKKIE